MRRCMGCMEEYEEQYDICPHCGYVHGTPGLEAYHIQPGSILQKRYIVGRVVGFGGFGVTYIGWDAELERKVAIKEYLPSEFATRMPQKKELTIFSGEKEEQFSSGMEKFLEESRKLARFQNTNGIVSIFDSFEENNTAYIVMEYLQGESLKQTLEKETKLSVEETVDIILPILYALKDVHAQGIVHRDIAPDNIFLTNERDEEGHRIVKLIDFGAARFATTRHSKSLSVLVKEGYSPEEQYRSRGDQGPWTDVYAVAATMYKMITGVTPQISMERSIKDEVKAPSKMGVKLSKGMENAILNAMNIKVENRTPSAEKLIEELESENTIRRKEKIKHVDVGKWPVWLKAVSGTAVAAVVALSVLVGLLMKWGPTSDMYIPEGYTRVPNLINLSEGRAKKEAERANLVFQVLGKEYSDEIPEGKVVRQTALGGSLMELPPEGTGETASANNEPGYAEVTTGTIGVVLSAGTQETVVPDVVHFLQADAISMLMESNLESAITEAEGDDAPGSVMTQNPEAESKVAGGTEVALAISTGKNFDNSVETKMPDVVGMLYDDAKALLLDKQLYLLKTEAVPDANTPKNQIISQDITAGTSVYQGSILSVKVSTGSDLILVPDVELITEAEAVQILEGKGFEVKVVYEENDTVARGLVIYQDVKANSSAKIGTTITIAISKGNKRANNTLTAADAVITQEIQEAADAAAAEAETKPIVTASNDNSDTSSGTGNTGSTPSKTPTSTSDTDATDKPTTTNATPEVVLISVPAVTGKSESAASSELANAGLVPVSVYAFNASVAEGNVISQSTAGGTQVGLATPVTITISKGPEAPSGWTTDGSFVNSRWYTTQTATEYRGQTRTKSDEEKSVVNNNQTYSEEGWTTVSSARTNWVANGGEHDNGTTAVSPYEDGTSKRTVSTYQISRAETYQSGTKTQYRYFYYLRSNGLYTWMDGITECTGWSDDPNYVDGKSFRVYGTATEWTGETRTSYVSSPKVRANELWYQDTQSVPVYSERTVNETGYKYQDYTAEFTHILKRTVISDWSAWSEWQNTAITSNDLTNVETRTVYYYTAK